MTGSSSDLETRARKKERRPATNGGGKAGLDRFMTKQRELLLTLRATRQEQLGERQAELANLADAPGPDEVQFDDESGEGNTTVFERERELALVELTQASIEDVDRALAKLDTGTYGRCEHCGQPIARPRLEALPAAQLCLECKGKPEGGGLSDMIRRQHRPAGARS